MKTINGSDILILDGGLGSIIEDTYKQNISHTPLWSTIPVLENPELIVDAHLAFLRAGAEIILTSTYQCSREAFEQAGYTPEEGTQIMHKSVKLANDARNAYLAEVESAEPTTRRDVYVALSLGPFGSTIQPTQDFDGFYPPPFGPKGPTPDTENSHNSASKNTRLFSSSDPGQENQDEKNAIEALAQFHLWRLRAISSTPETWNSITYIAFETVPHLRELRAIKVAMAMLDSDLEKSGGLKGSHLKGWWISLVFPDGSESVQWGQEERERQTRSLHPTGTVGDVTSSQSSRHSEILNVLLDDTLGAVPTGLGINCTKIDQYPSILSSIVSNSRFATTVDKEPIPLTLVVYPNGGRLGETFDPLTYRWIDDGRPRPDGRNIAWEEEVVEVVQQCRGDWKDVIVGGCCRVYPPQVKTLRENVNKSL